ncbi:MAG: spore coat protein [Clostridia bacterium]|nr:spore coat protein [Clostridia bacterium]
MQISQKEFLNLTDILNSHASAIECLNADIQDTQDGQLRQILQNHERVYRQHYDALVNVARQRGIDGSAAVGYSPQLGMQGGFVGNVGGFQAFQPQTGGKRVSDRAIAVGCLDRCKQNALTLTWAAIESATPDVRRLFLDMARDHVEMAFELFAFLNQRQWYPVPAVNQQMVQQMANAFQPVGAPAPVGAYGAAY